MYSFSNTFQASFFVNIGMNWQENRQIMHFFNGASSTLKILMNLKVYMNMFYPWLYSGCEQQKCNDCSYSKQAY